MGRGDIARGAPDSGLRALARLRAVGADPRAEIAALKERTGSRVAAYFDAYMPEEVLMAHGLLPYRVAVDGRDEVRATEHIQSYTCPAARNLLEQALRGDLGFVDVAVFTRYCDSLRGVYASWHASRLSPDGGVRPLPDGDQHRVRGAVPRRRVEGALRPVGGGVRPGRRAVAALGHRRRQPQARAGGRVGGPAGRPFAAADGRRLSGGPAGGDDHAARRVHPGTGGAAGPPAGGRARRRGAGGAGGDDLRQRRPGGGDRERGLLPGRRRPLHRLALVDGAASTRPATRGWRWPGPT